MIPSPLFQGIHTLWMSLLFLLLASVSCVHRTDPFSHSVTTAETPWTHTEFKDDPDDFQFAILSDRTGGMREGVFASAVGKMNSLQPEFVISVGDYIQGNTRDVAQVQSEWDEMDHITSGFEMPFFVLPGNHDITNPEMKAVYEQRFGSRYYAFVYKDVLFLCLDTQDRPVASDLSPVQDAGLTTNQIAWAQDVLHTHSQVRWTVVLMHQPLWVYDATRPPEKATGWEAIESALDGRKTTVIAGHLHRYSKSIHQDHNFFVLATTGGGSKLRGPSHGEFDHAVWVTMTPAGPRLANLMLDGIFGDDPPSE